MTTDRRRIEVATLEDAWQRIDAASRADSSFGLLDALRLLSLMASEVEYARLDGTGQLMCPCGHTRESHLPGECVGCTGPSCFDYRFLAAAVSVHPKGHTA